jgi:hypothetical protein
MDRTLTEARVGFRFDIDAGDRQAALRVHEAAYGAMEQALRTLPGWRRHVANGPGPQDDTDDHYAQLCDIDLVMRDVGGRPCFCLWVRRDAAFELERVTAIRDAVIAVYERAARAAGVTVTYRGAVSEKVWRVTESQDLAGV